ncbi:MAG: DUF1566 domain-containing protein [Candidatus Thiothrix putei]|uniref:DUF1566 domain-containing protein n=1 Tax=Candidatus Thiothrix putei TaxID=3080811 RepID=A0AA95KNV8_9GAMM|nr:MAG: DUF1566 domain-containing protein [Candidatus Thiothrix putei]
MQMTTQSTGRLYANKGLFLAVALSASLLTACGGGGGSSASNDNAATPSPAPGTTNPTTTAPATRTFTQLDANGGDVTPGLESAACVKDSQSGRADRYWEAKTDEPSGQTLSGETFRDKDYGYFWFDGTGGAKGPAAGAATVANLFSGTPCQAYGTTLKTCDTKDYIAAVNAAKVCNKTTWRLPTKDELMSLVDSTQTQKPYIKPVFGSTAAEDPAGANQVTRGYWTSTAVATDASRRVAISFGSKNGLVEEHLTHGSHYNYVRLIAD